MNYQEAIEILFSKRPRRSRDDLEIARTVSKTLGSPETAYPTIHVTGTNGKGSVCLKIAKVLENAGLKCGLFTSPHIVSFCERITINGVEISEERVRDGLLKLFKMEKSLCFFELATLLAFDYFREQKVDIAVIEAGVGGLLDTTNIITPLVSIITSVAHDHGNILGKTLEEIAFQKAGIIKPGAPVVIGPNADFSVIRKRAEACHSPLFKVEPKPGFYDFENSAIARQAIEILKFPLEGVDVRPRCRFEAVGPVILDVAHNPAGFAKLLEAYDFHFPGEPFSAVVGMSNDKDTKSCLALLTPRAEHLYLVQADAPKALSVVSMSQMLRQDGYFHFTAGLSIRESLKTALTDHKRVVVCGSFYIMKEVYEILRIQIGHDKLSLNRC